MKQITIPAKLTVTIVAEQTKDYSFADWFEAVVDLDGRADANYKTAKIAEKLIGQFKAAKDGDVVSLEDADYDAAKPWIETPAHGFPSFSGMIEGKLFRVSLGRKLLVFADAFMSATAAAPPAPAPAST